MNSDQTHELMEQLLLISHTLNQLNQNVSQVNLRQHRIEERISQVERCLTNLRSDVNQSQSRTIWSDDERAAYALWLTSAQGENDGFPVLPVDGE